MLKKILFVFAGTGDTAQSKRDEYEDSMFSDDVIRVYFSGCQNKAIGGSSLGRGYISPNLDTVASKIRKSFNTNRQLSLSELKKEFGKAIIIEPDSTDCVEIENISLTGFSRGGVTTFAVARHLDDLGTPIRLFAADPVPGNNKNKAKQTSSEFYKNHDLRYCMNLVEAQILLGCYKKDVNPLHNKFFRQMAPFFSDACKSAIYTVPKTHHLHFSRKGENQEIDFLMKGGLRPENTGYYCQEKDRMMFTPKIIQQKHHIGTLGRIEMLPRYKTALFELVSRNYNISEDISIKMAQALYALDFASEFEHKDLLISTVINDTTANGKAIREFIVEFENINQYAFRKGDDEKCREVMNQFRSNIYQYLYSFLIEKANQGEKQELVGQVLNELNTIKEGISKKQYKELKALMTLFLKDNVIFYPDYTQYLDETETFNKGPSTLKTPDQAMATIDNVQNGAEMAEMLYQMSENSRECAYDKFPQKLHEVITDIHQLGNVLRFIPIKHIEKILKNKEIEPIIKNVNDLNIIMGKMSCPAKKTAIYNAMRNGIKAMELNFTGLGDLMQGLPSSECKRLASSLNFNKIPMYPSTDVISFFEKLNDKQFNKVISEMADAIKSYFGEAIAKDKGQELKGYLEKRITDPGVKKIFDGVFLDIKSIIHYQRDLKARLAIEKAAFESSNDYHLSTINY